MHFTLRRSPPETKQTRATKTPQRRPAPLPPPNLAVPFPARRRPSAPTMSSSRIEYSEKYADEDNEYRCVAGRRDGCRRPASPAMTRAAHVDSPSAARRLHCRRRRGKIDFGRKSMPLCRVGVEAPAPRWCRPYPLAPLTPAPGT